MATNTVPETENMVGGPSNALDTNSPEYTKLSALQSGGPYIMDEASWENREASHDSSSATDKSKREALTGLPTATRKPDILVESNNNVSALLDRRMDPTQNRPYFPQGLPVLPDDPIARLARLKEIVSDESSHTLSEIPGQISTYNAFLNGDLLIDIQLLVNSTAIVSFNARHLYIALIPKSPFFESPEDFARGIDMLEGRYQVPGRFYTLLQPTAFGETELMLKGATTHIITVGLEEDFQDLTADGPTRPKYPKQVEELKKLCRDKLKVPTTDFVYTLPAAHRDPESNEYFGQMSFEFSLVTHQLRIFLTDDRYGNGPEGAFEITEPKTQLLASLP